jgi:rod shape-determining protein MreD
LPLLAAGSRREVEERPQPLLLSILAAAIAIGLQSFVPLYFPKFAILDLPLLITIYLAISGRNAINATLAGAIIGMAQDALTHRPIGVNGIAKALIGYLGASLGSRIDTENPGARLLLSFAFTMLHSAIVVLVGRHMLGLDAGWVWLHELLRGGINAVVGVVLFTLLDRMTRCD